jgi:hypothetical protein
MPGAQPKAILRAARRACRTRNQYRRPRRQPARRVLGTQPGQHQPDRDTGRRPRCRVRGPFHSTRLMIARARFPAAAGSGHIPTSLISSCERVAGRSIAVICAGRTADARRWRAIGGNVVAAVCCCRRGPVARPYPATVGSIQGLGRPHGAYAATISNGPAPRDI